MPPATRPRLQAGEDVKNLHLFATGGKSGNLCQLILQSLFHVKC